MSRIPEEKLLHLLLLCLSSAFSSPSHLFPWEVFEVYSPMALINNDRYRFVFLLSATTCWRNDVF
ncbi:hypothetical protein PO909_026566 [Leuciscus waleckii]